MFGRSRRAIVEQEAAATAAEEILSLLISKGLVRREEAVECLRSIAGNIVGRSYATGAGDAGRALAAHFERQADQLDRGVTATPVLPFHKRG